MRIDLDDTHEHMIQAAIAAGEASDARSYVQSLIDQAAADRWIGEHRPSIEDTLRDRLKQTGVERERGDFDTLRSEVEAIVKRRQQRRGA